MTAASSRPERHHVSAPLVIFGKATADALVFDAQHPQRQDAADLSLPCEVGKSLPYLDCEGLVSKADRHTLTPGRPLGTFRERNASDSKFLPLSKGKISGQVVSFARPTRAPEAMAS